MARAHEPCRFGQLGSLGPERDEPALLHEPLPILLRGAEDASLAGHDGHVEVGKALARAKPVGRPRGENTGLALQADLGDRVGADDVGEGARRALDPPEGHGPSPAGRRPAEAVADHPRPEGVPRGKREALPRGDDQAARGRRPSRDRPANLPFLLAAHANPEPAAEGLDPNGRLQIGIGERRARVRSHEIGHAKRLGQGLGHGLGEARRRGRDLERGRIEHAGPAVERQMAQLGRTHGWSHGHEGQDPGRSLHFST